MWSLEGVWPAGKGETSPVAWGRGAVAKLNNTIDLRKGVSGAKFDAECDSEVRLAVAPSKSIKNDEKLNSDTENFPIFLVLLMFLVPPSVAQGLNFDNTQFSTSPSVLRVGQIRKLICFYKFSRKLSRSLPRRDARSVKIFFAIAALVSRNVLMLRL